MKIWKKVYLAALVIITIGVNAGFAGIIKITYNQMLAQEKNRSVTEFASLRENISADVAQLEHSVMLNEEYFERFLIAYNSYYDEDTKLIGCVSDMAVTGEDVYKKLPKENGVFIEDEGRTVIYVAQLLDDKHQEYRVIMRRTLDEFDGMWDRLTPLYIVGGIVLSVCVSLVLALIVRVVLKPMDALEDAARKVEEGDWSARVNIEGNNELARLGRQFNAMAISVENNIIELARQSDEKQGLINNLAHEMNTPITSIQGFADYMRRAKLTDEEYDECLEYITSESARLKNISSTLLSMARLNNESDNAALLEETFSIKTMCEGLKNIYEHKYAEYDIDLKINCEIDEFFGNQTLIESMLNNLVTNGYNAVIYRMKTEKHKGEISVDICKRKSMLTIEVCDNGCGMEEAHMSRIFEPFYRVDKARSREYGGSGLGLPFVKRIVQLHGGTIEVSSRVNEGTKLLINLPFDNFSKSI